TTMNTTDRPDLSQADSKRRVGTCCRGLLTQRMGIHHLSEHDCRDLGGDYQNLLDTNIAAALIKPQGGSVVFATADQTSRMTKNAGGKNVTAWLPRRYVPV
ncbi:hypothetical protein, partial [Burkholderia cenocepacia]|uniref:hypothetical protein n=1 Tax=Burkholderia cenocepacia TaxID=95486 RepID=UPI00209B32FC